MSAPGLPPTPPRPRLASGRPQPRGLALLRWLQGWWQVLFLGAQLLVLAASPSSYTAATRARTTGHMVAGTWPMLLWFAALAALVTLVITRIVVVTAQSYGLTQYALQVVIRVLVIELIPLAAVLFVALRSTLAGATELARMPVPGAPARLGGPVPARQALPVPETLLVQQALPRVLAGLHASLTLAALSCVVAAVLAYLAVYGFNLAALPAYTRLFGQVFSPSVTLIFVLKTLFFSLAVAVLPVASALYDRATWPSGGSGGPHVLARMFAVLLLIEVLCLMGNYA